MLHYSNHLRNDILARGLLVSTLRLKAKNALKKTRVDANLLLLKSYCFPCPLARRFGSRDQIYKNTWIAPVTLPLSGLFKGTVSFQLPSPGTIKIEEDWV